MLLKYIQQSGPLGYMLVGISVLSTVVILERCWFWLVQGQPVTARTRDRWLADCRKKEHPALNNKSPEGRALSYAYAHRNAHDDAPLDIAMSREIRMTDRFLSVLDNNAAIAPMLGILGTIIGIIQAFTGMKGDIPDTGVMVRGISVAMLTTAIGLIVALLSLISYNCFADRAHKRQVQTAELLQEAWLILKGKKQQSAEQTNRRKTTNKGG